MSEVAFEENPGVLDPPPPRNWSVASVVGAVVSAFVASLCCLGPLVFALLGIGGAGLLMKFAPYRPYYIALTLGFLGLAFYFTYRRTPAARARVIESEPGCACEYPRSNRLGRMMLWVATILVIIFLTFPYIASILFG
jgi:mercuric ion transport protein